MSANPHFVIGGSSWSGNPPLATTRQLLSTSTDFGNSISTIETQISTIEIQISSLVVSGGVSLWANFAAVNNVNMAAFSLLNATLVSTLGLNVSSINGNDININASTVGIAGIEISGSTITTGLGGTIITSGGVTTSNVNSKTYTVSDVVNSLGAAVDTVTDAGQALTGVFGSAQTAAQVASVAYGVGTIACGVSIANGTVDLATKTASLFTSRTANTISGNAVPGQTTAVYETINGTTQFQFSTLGTATTTVFRTTDKADPNQTFGNEIFISSIIPAGSKCVRSVSDPLQFVMISSILISTNNFLQSYGQWSPVLAPEFNLNVSTLTADNIFTGFLSSPSIITNLINNSITVTNSNFCNVGQFQANNGIFSNAILVTNNAQVGSLTSLGAISGTSGSFSGNVGLNILNATGAVNGATAVISGSISGGSLFTLNNTVTGTLAATSATIGALTVSGAAGVNSLTVTNAATAGSLSVIGLTTLATLNAATVNTIEFSTGSALISSIKGVNIDTILNPAPAAAFPPNLSSLTFSTGSSEISSINGYSFADLLNPAAVTFSTVSTFLQIFTSSLVASNINTNVLQGNQVFTASLQGLNISTGSGFISQLNLSSLVASNINTNFFLTNQQLTSSIQALNISTGVLQTGILSASTITTPLNFSLVSTVANQSNIAGVNTTLLKSFISLTSPIPLLNLTNQGGVPQVFNDANFSYWNDCAFQAGTTSPDVYAVSISQLVVNTAGQVDFYIGLATTIQINYPGGSTLIGDFGSGFPGQARFTFAAGVWTFTNSFAGGSVINTNNFQISQNVSQTLLQTTDSLIISTALLEILAPTNFQTLITQQFNASTISSVNVNTLRLIAPTISNSNLFTTNITNTNTTTTNITASNLFASNTTTSSINIKTGVSSFITGAFSNNFVLNTYTNPPNVNVGLLTSQLQTFSSNPSFTYSGTGPDIITLDSGNRVWLNTTLQSPASIGWFLTTVTATTGVRVNISTVSGVQNNYSINQQIANLVATTAAPIALYTSAAGFIGNIASASVTLKWNGTDYTTATLVPFTGVNFINNTSLAQSISTFSITTTSNIQFNSGVASNVPSISFGGRTLEVFRQRLDGFVTNAGNFGKGDANATIVSPYGQTFPVSQYNCIVTQSAVNIYQQYSLALGEQAWTTLADGNGNWKLQFNLTTPTIPAAYNPNFYAIAGVTMIPYDLGHFSGFQSPTNLGEGAGPGPFFAEIQLSTVTTSTLTLLVNDNISITAGIAVPAFLGTGNIFIGGTDSVELVGDSAVIGGLVDVDIEAVGRDVLVSAASTISLTAYNTLMSNAGDIDLYAGSNMRIRLYAPHNNIEDKTGNIINFGSNVYDSFTNIGDQRVKYGTVSGSNIMDVTNITGHINLNASSNNIILTGQNFTLTDPVSGGSGNLTVDAGNSLYWNGTFIA